MSSNDDFSPGNVHNDEPVMSNKVSFTVINTNARSLSPKINSLIDCFSQMEASVGVVMETWLSDGADLDEEIGDLTSGTGLSMVYSCLLYTSPSPRD